MLHAVTFMQGSLIDNCFVFIESSFCQIFVHVPRLQEKIPGQLSYDQSMTCAENRLLLVLENGSQL